MYFKIEKCTQKHIKKIMKSRLLKAVLPRVVLLVLLIVEKKLQFFNSLHLLSLPQSRNQDGLFWSQKEKDKKKKVKGEGERRGRGRRKRKKKNKRGKKTKPKTPTTL